MCYSVSTTWDEGTIRACLYLYLNLLPLDHELIGQLATVYAASNTEVKKVGAVFLCFS
jgi:symplekin